MKMPKVFFLFTIGLLFVVNIPDLSYQQCLCSAPKWFRLTDNLVEDGQRYCYRPQEITKDNVTLPKYAEIVFKKNINVLRFRVKLRCGFLEQDFATLFPIAQGDREILAMIGLVPYATAFGSKNPFRLENGVLITGPKNAVPDGQLRFVEDNPRSLDELDLHIMDEDNHILSPPSEEEIPQIYLYPGIRNVKDLRTLDLPVRNGPLGFSKGNKLRIWHGSIFRDDHFWSPTSETCIDLLAFGYEQD